MTQAIKTAMLIPGLPATDWWNLKKMISGEKQYDSEYVIGLLKVDYGLVKKKEAV